MSLLEPTVVPGLDKALLRLFAIFGVVIVTGLAVTVSSIVGVIRAISRRRRGGHSMAAVVFAALANGIAAAWLLNWLAHDIHDRSNPINALFAINAALCVLPLTWLVAAIRANRARDRESISQ